MDANSDDQVQLLPPDLASQIAAGEVVERPASALKELLENSVDASATRCSVEIEGGGVTRICVLDDGRGMSPSDARRALERHATSKLRALGDLDCLSSYGFRGEALPSIASVSRFTLRTRRSQDAAGIELCANGSLEPEVRPVGCAVGTFIEVRDLFFNVPARRKFLRSTGTESGHLTDVVDQLALARPDLALTLRRDGRSCRTFHRAGSREERARQHFDQDLLGVRGTRGPIEVEAYLSRPDGARAGTQGLRLLVNGRPIRDRALAVAAAHAYGSQLERGLYPRGVIYLDLPPQLVDFNVHPQKLELRFAEPRAVGEALYRVLRTGIAERFDPTPAAAPSVAASARSSTPRESAELSSSVGSRPSRRLEQPSPLHAPSISTPNGSDVAATSVANDPSDPRVSRPALPTTQAPPTGLVYLGQTSRGHLLCESSSGVCIVDVRAASERIALCSLRDQLRKGSLQSQSLLFPCEVVVGHEESIAIEHHSSELSKLGMKLVHRQAQRWTVHSVPQLLRRITPARLLRLMAEALAAKPNQDLSDSLRDCLPILACEAALNPSERISAEQATDLLSALHESETTAGCIHDSPIVHLASWDELSRMVR